MYWDFIKKKHDESVYRSEGIRVSLLDIGAGNGKLYSTFKEIAEEQPLLNEYYYRPIDKKEYFETCSIKKVYGFENYGRNPKVIINDGESDIDCTVDMSQFMLMLKNCSIEDIDLTELEYIEDGYSKSKKDIFLERIENFKPSSSFRSPRERLANRVLITDYKVIEKSQVLINHMPEEAKVVGTDFDVDTLVDKPTQVIFCNPPYSEYEKWAEKIILEANAQTIYLVIPKRWGKQGNIAGALKQRRATVKVIGNFDFLNAEDRKARAKVSLVKVNLCGKDYVDYRGYSHKRSEQKVDPFDLWFDTFFKFNAVKDENERIKKIEEDENNRKEEIEHAVVNGYDLVSVLVNLYNKELDHLLNNYKKLGELDEDILKELKVDVSQLRTAFKQKIEGLKLKYWKEVFNNLHDITSRLTSRTRDSLMNTLLAQTNLDFTPGNIRSIAIWVIKNANKYYESQMLEVYDDFTTEEGIKLYKSNKRFNEDTWRYNRHENLDKYSLDYRIVKHGWLSDFDVQYRDSISDNQKQSIRDIIVIAENLGFKLSDNLSINNIQRRTKEFLYFSPEKNRFLKKGTKTNQGKIIEVYYHTNKPNENGERVMEKDGITYVYDTDSDNTYQYKLDDGYYYHPDSLSLASDVFTSIKGFNNGNVHFQFNKKFIKKLNLEVGRLRGWIKNPQEAATEFDISLDEANEYWNSTFQALPETLNNLLPSAPVVEEKLEDPIFEFNEDYFRVDIVNASSAFNEDQFNRIKEIAVWSDTTYDKDIFGFCLTNENHLKLLDKLEFDYSPYLEKYEKVAIDGLLHVVPKEETEISDEYKNLFKDGKLF